MADPEIPSQAPDDDATRLFTGGMVAPSALPPGTVLGKTYAIERLLGRGGMGEVYCARHIELGTEHAIEIILPGFAEDPKVVQLFREETRKLGRINNAAIVNYEGFFRDEHGLSYLVTEFVEGEPLEVVLRRLRLEPNEVLGLRDRLALGLAAAHEMDIVHGDVSPANILLPQSSIDRAKLINFGIAKPMAAGATQFGGGLAGEYSFASPEQVGLYGGKVDPRSDIYSLGLVLAAASIGFDKRLDMGNSPATMLAARQRVPDLSEVPALLRPVIAPMLEPRPDDRPPSMRALLRYEGEAGRRRVSREVRTAEGSWRRRALLAIAVGSTLAALFVAALFALRQARPPPSSAGLRAELVAATAGYRCAALGYEIGPDGSVRVAGYAASEADIDRIRQAVGSIAGIAKLDFAVALRIWPFCELSGILHELSVHPPRVAPSLALLPTADAAYLGEPLYVDVRAPSFDGYLYVDFFDRRGGVLHLFPNARDKLNFRPARNHLTLGRPPFGRCWVLGGATGEQLVSLVAAVDPLFPAPRPEIEDARAYLPSLSRAVAALPPHGGAAALRFFQLRPAPPFAPPETGCQS